MKESTPREPLVRPAPKRHPAQDKLLSLLGNSPEGRAPLVAGMLRRDASEATSYWFQLVVSIGIATLGLVVGSTAVVIAAMLVAPLMGPIVGLAMGLASGSPFLVLRSAGRIGMSIVVAVGGAALITVALPYHEPTAEIAARTSPTVLDLITAAFCALAGVYASLRPTSDTATTAAGTSIGISLVPPLCASGYGFGTGMEHVARGAGLLFLTNLVAIVVVGTLAYVVSGFNTVDVVALEREELRTDRPTASISRALARRIWRLFDSPFGPAIRFLMPLLLLAAVYAPLRRALDEVAWQVRVRAAVTQTIAREPLRVVQSRIRVERHEVEVLVVILGSTEDAASSRGRLDEEIRTVSGVIPRVEVYAVPDADAMAGLQSSLLARPPVEIKEVVVPPTPEEQLTAARADVQKTIAEAWPADASGAPLLIDLGTALEGPVGIRVVHLGAPLSPQSAETLRRVATARFSREVLIEDVAVPSAPLTREGGDLAFVGAVASGVRATASVSSVSVCVGRPEAPPRARATKAAEAELAKALLPILATHPRVTTEDATAWSVLFVAGPCPPSPEGPNPKSTKPSQ